MKMITAELLESKKACVDQVDLFRSLWPNGVTPTRELCIEHADRFDWHWAAKNLLSEDGYKAYDEAKASALKAYKEAIATIWFNIWQKENSL